MLHPRPDRHITRLHPLIWIYLIFVMLPIRFTVGSLQFTGLRGFLLVMIIPLLFWLWETKHTKARQIDLLICAHVLWVMIALSQTSPTQSLENASATFLELFGGYAIARVFIRDKDDLMAFIRLLTLAIFITLPMAIYETLTGDAFIVQMIHNTLIFSSVSDIDIESRLGLERVQAVFAHPIHYGLFCSSATTLMFVGLSEELRPTRRILALSIIVTCSFLALSSGAFISVLLQLFLICWAFVFARFRRRWLILALSCLALYVAIDLASTRTPIRVFMSYATFSAHNAYWRGLIFEWGMFNVAQNPVFGLGLNDWVRPYYMYSGSMDNFWLVNAVRYGIPGFLTLAAAIVLGIGQVAYARLLPQYQTLRRAWVICFVGLSFTLATVHIWTAIFSFVFFLFGAGMWFLDAKNATKPATKTPKRQRNFRFTRFQEAFT